MTITWQLYGKEMTVGLFITSQQYKYLCCTRSGL